jgi:hypothetical protein
VTLQEVEPLVYLHAKIGNFFIDSVSIKKNVQEGNKISKNTAHIKGTTLYGGFVVPGNPH